MIATAQNFKYQMSIPKKMKNICGFLQQIKIFN